MFGPPVSAEPSNSLTALLDKKDLTANFFPIYFYILPQLGLTIAKQDTHTFTCMSNNMWCPLLVSKGTGTWGNPFRASCTGSPCQLKHMVWLHTNNSAQVCGHCLRPRCTHTEVATGNCVWKIYFGKQIFFSPTYQHYKIYLCHTEENIFYLGHTV